MHGLQAVVGFAEVFEVVSTRRALTLGPAIIYPNRSGIVKYSNVTNLVVRIDYFPNLQKDDQHLTCSALQKRQRDDQTFR
jgi:hypothetical protein